MNKLDRGCKDCTLCFFLKKKIEDFSIDYCPLSWYNDVNFHERGRFLCPKL